MLKDLTNDTPTRLSREDKLAMLLDKKARIVYTVGDIDQLIADLEAPEVTTESKYNKVLRRYRKANPELMKQIANSVKLMDMMPPKPVDDPIDMSVLTGYEKPSEDSNKLTLATTR